MEKCLVYRFQNHRIIKYSPKGSKNHPQTRQQEQWATNEVDFVLYVNKMYVLQMQALASLQYDVHVAIVVSLVFVSKNCY